LIGIFVFAVGIFNFQNSIKKSLILSERSAFNKAAFLLQEKVKSFVHGLQGLGGVYRATNFSPTDKIVRDYALFRNFFSNFPGAVGFGFVRRVSHLDLTTYVRQREKLSPHFKFRQQDTSKQEFYFIVESLEPFEKNLGAIGFDVGSEIKRRITLESSVETGLPTITAPINLVQVDKKVPGLLFYLPLYKAPLTPSSLLERKKQIVGFSSVAILSSSLIEFLEKSTDSRLVLKLSDSNGDLIHVDDKEVDFRFKNPKDWMREDLSIGGRKWILQSAVIPSKSFQYINIFSFIAFFLLSFIHCFLVFRIRNLFISRELSVIKAKEIKSWQEAILEASNYSIISTRPDGVISTFNKAASSILGYAPEELIDLKDPTAFHDAQEVMLKAADLSKELSRDIKPGFDTFAAIAKESENKTFECTYITKSGERIPVKLSISVILDDGGCIIGYLGIAEDLRLFNQLNRTIEDQRVGMIASGKMAALGEMAAGIAHEINNPLAIISGHATLATMMLDEETINRENLQKSLTKIEQTCGRIGKIVSGLKNFSRESSADPMEEVLLSKILQDTIDLCHERLKRNAVELIVLGDFSFNLKCKSVQISQVLMNLISNSLDAISNLNEKWLKIEANRGSDHIWLTITDSGHGIPSGIVDKIMQPFFTTKQVGKGTGLGLSISKGIIEAHGGEFLYCPESSHTQFKIKFPIMNDDFKI
jgi:PAS domain S-box-containing protein